MVNRTAVSWRRASGALCLACAATAIILSTSPAVAAEPEAACANVANEQLRQEAEQRRRESNVNAATAQPYSTGLPDCRAYEMVSPLYKQSRDVESVLSSGLLVAPEGDAAGFHSQGAFSEPENELQGAQNVNNYVSRRGPSGWVTSSTFPPLTLIPGPSTKGLGSDFSVDLRSAEVSCGTSVLGRAGDIPPRVACARRNGSASEWMRTPFYSTPENTSELSAEYAGASSDLSRVFLQPQVPLQLPSPPSDTALSGSIYEIAGVNTETPQLRLVNVECPPPKATCLPTEEQELVLRFKSKRQAPYLGDRRRWGGAGGLAIKGTAYHAVSENGETVFFSATPLTPEGSEGQTIYARVGNGTAGAHTIAVSAQSATECTSVSCTSSEPLRVGQAGAAVYQGASADGSKVFFTTAQKLLNSDENELPDLYEYDFSKPSGKNLILISSGQPGHAVTGVVRTSSDGSHVYFVQSGVLATAQNENTWRNGQGEEQHEKAQEGTPNIYAYDAVTGEGKFVASTGEDTGGVTESFDEGLGEEEVHGPRERHAQTTPDGRYLVFSSRGQLAGDTNSGAARAAYRYDFQTGELTWVSHATPGFTPLNAGDDAIVAAVPGSPSGSEADMLDWSRAISDNGEYIIFTTAERLQASDVNESLDVYEWHNGGTGLISDGHDPLGGSGEGKHLTVASGMSASGSDIFFLTHTPLVGQDTDALVDLYDARVAGGFPAPPAGTACSGEPCQGPASKQPSFGAATSSMFPASGNPTTPLIAVAPSMEVKPKSLTRAQKLANALKLCKKKLKKKRAACESQARKKFASRAKAKRTPRRK